MRCTLSTVADMESDDIVALRQRLARTLLKSTNMHLEGLLSEVKASVPKGKRARHAEKLAYTSHLSRLLKQHLAHGREDCRGEDRRRTLLSRGAPVEGPNPPGAQPQTFGGTISS